MSNIIKKTEATDVVAKETAPVVVNVDARSYSRLGWLIVLLGIGGFAIWALIAPLDQGVAVHGNVAVSGNRKAIQHPTGGVVEQILVKEGDTVKAGQPLVRMNEVQSRANYEATRMAFLSARATEARLLAERDGKGRVSFPEEVLKAKGDARIASVISVQEGLFLARQAALQSDLRATQEGIEGLKSQLGGMQEVLENLKQQQGFLKEQVTGMRDLAKDGYVARNRLLDVERTYAQVNGSVAETIANIGRVQRQIGELSARQSLRREEYQKEVRAQLTEVQREAEIQGNRFKAVEYENAHVVLEAPVDGRVLALNVFTKGAVLNSGFRVMDIVPSDDPLVVEGQVPVHLIDKVHPGLKVEMIFSAFNQQKTPHIPGEVVTVAADRLVDERTGMPYYKMTAKVTPDGVKKLAEHQVRPGMPVDVFVKTGERTMMNYLMKPLVDRAKTSLTEE